MCADCRLAYSGLIAFEPELLCAFDGGTFSANDDDDDDDGWLTVASALCSRLAGLSRELITRPSFVSRCVPSSEMFERKLIAANLRLDCCRLTSVAI